jgi:hypothetical protein
VADVPVIPAGEITITQTAGTPSTTGSATDTFTIACGSWSVSATREQLSQIASRIRSVFLTPPPGKLKRP